MTVSDDPIVDGGLAQDDPRIELMREIGNKLHYSGLGNDTSFVLLLNLAGVFLARWDPPNRRRYLKRCDEVVDKSAKEFAKHNPLLVPNNDAPGVH